MKYPHHKFKAQRTELDGIKFASKKEAKYYQDLKLLQQVGEVVFFLRQPRFDLPGGTKYYADFLVFWSNGTASFVDVKGHRTKSYIRAKKQVEALYPVTIEEV